MTENEDCYFFYNSSCTKGSWCPYRHEPLALDTQQICSDWINGRCLTEHCSLRHIKPEPDKSKVPCFFESTPGGCTKFNCPFLHASRLSAVYKPQPSTLNSTAVPVQSSDLINALGLGSTVKPSAVIPPVTATVGKTGLTSAKTTTSLVSSSDGRESKPVVATVSTVNKTAKVPSNISTSSLMKSSQSSDLETTKRKGLTVGERIRQAKAAAVRGTRKRSTEPSDEEHGERIEKPVRVPVNNEVKENSTELKRSTVIQPKTSENKDSGEDGLGLKSLEQITREKAIESMKRNRLLKQKAAEAAAAAAAAEKERESAELRESCDRSEKFDLNSRRVVVAKDSRGRSEEDSQEGMTNRATSEVGPSRPSIRDRLGKRKSRDELDQRTLARTDHGNIDKDRLSVRNRLEKNRIEDRLKNRLENRLVGRLKDRLDNRLENRLESRLGSRRIERVERYSSEEERSSGSSEEGEIRERSDGEVRKVGRNIRRDRITDENRYTVRRTDRNMSESDDYNDVEKSEDDDDNLDDKYSDSESEEENRYVSDTRLSSKSSSDDRVVSETTSDSIYENSNEKLSSAESSENLIAERKVGNIVKGKRGWGVRKAGSDVRLVDKRLDTKENDDSLDDCSDKRLGSTESAENLEIKKVGNTRMVGPNMKTKKDGGSDLDWSLHVDSGSESTARRVGALGGEGGGVSRSGSDLVVREGGGGGVTEIKIIRTVTLEDDKKIDEESEERRRKRAERARNSRMIWSRHSNFEENRNKIASSSPSSVEARDTESEECVIRAKRREPVRAIYQPPHLTGKDVAQVSVRGEPVSVKERLHNVKDRLHSNQPDKQNIVQSTANKASNSTLTESLLPASRDRLKPPIKADMISRKSAATVEKKPVTDWLNVKSYSEIMEEKRRKVQHNNSDDSSLVSESLNLIPATQPPTSTSPRRPWGRENNQPAENSPRKFTPIIFDVSSAKNGQNGNKSSVANNLKRHFTEPDVNLALKNRKIENTSDLQSTAESFSRTDDSNSEAVHVVKDFNDSRPVPKNITEKSSAEVSSHRELPREIPAVPVRSESEAVTSVASNKSKESTSAQSIKSTERKKSLDFFSKDFDDFIDDFDLDLPSGLEVGSSTALTSMSFDDTDDFVAEMKELLS